MKVTVKLETFEGPLDLLLHLIDKAEVDIYDIPIKDITDQYMEYLDAMQELELEVTSEFLVMAATLLSIKSKMLLPKPPVVDLEFDDYMMDEDYDPRAELVAKLIEYRKYKAIADHLRDKEVERSLIFTREPEDLTPYVSTVIENPVKDFMLPIWFMRFAKRCAACTAGKPSPKSVKTKFPSRTGCLRCSKRWRAREAKCFSPDFCKRIRQGKR